MKDKIRVDSYTAYSRDDLYKAMERKLEEINQYSFFRFKEAQIVVHHDVWVAFIFYWVLATKDK